LQHQTTSVVVRGKWVEVHSGFVRATRNLLLVTNAIAVVVVHANSVTVQEWNRRVFTSACTAQCRSWVVVAGSLVGAANATREVTQVDNDVVRFGIVVASERKQTSCHQTTSVVLRGRWVVPGVAFFSASKHFQFVANAVAIRIVDAVALAVHKLVREITAVVVDGRIHVVVASQVVGATGTAFKLTSTWKLVIDGSVVVARLLNQTSAHKARAIVKAGIRIEPWVGGIGAASNFFVVANAIAVGVRVTVTTTHAQGVKLVAVTVAVSGRDVGASTLVDVTWSVANATSIKLAYTIVLVVADAIGIGISFTRTSALTERVLLVAIAVAISGRDVFTATLVDVTWSVADAASIELTDAFVDIVANAIGIDVSFTRASALTERVFLVAVTIAVASRDVFTAALVDLTWSVADTTSIKLAYAFVDIVTNAIGISVC
jgi:hypothetical protein